MFRYSVLQLRQCVAGARLISQTTRVAGSKKTHYEVLGLTPFASQDDIRTAFLKLSKEIHPDANPDDPNSHAKFVRLNEAYSVLSKPLARREYDVGLAYWIRARNVSQSHTAGSSTAPGSGQHTNYDSGDQQTANEFWDETIWEMRDRTKDAGAFYDTDSYYGIKGIRKKSNGTIATVIVVSVAVGSVFYFFFSLHRSHKHLETVRNMSAQNSRMLKEVQEQARINGTAKQLEILQEKIAAAEAKRQALMASFNK